MLDFFKTQKKLGITLVITVVISTTLLVLSIMDKSVIDDQKYQIEEQIANLNRILGKESAVTEENLKIAKKKKIFLESVFKRLSTRLSEFHFNKESLTALNFKSKLTNVVTELDRDMITADIDNTKKVFLTSLKDLDTKRESKYSADDIKIGLEKLIVLKQLSEATKGTKLQKLSSLEAITWQTVKNDEESFTSTLKLELEVTGSQSSIMDLVNAIALDPKVFFIIQGIQISNISKFTKPAPVKKTGTKDADLDSKESKEVIVDNTLTCKLYIDIVQFKLNQEK